MRKMIENKMADINRMIRELEEANIDDSGVCVLYCPYKKDVPILVNALKMYQVFMTANKMEAVAHLFGKELGEEFSIKWEDVEYMCVCLQREGYGVTLKMS